MRADRSLTLFHFLVLRRSDTNLVKIQGSLVSWVSLVWAEMGFIERFHLIMLRYIAWNDCDNSPVLTWIAAGQAARRLHHAIPARRTLTRLRASAVTTITTTDTPPGTQAPPLAPPTMTQPTLASAATDSFRSLSSFSSLSWYSGELRSTVMSHSNLQRNIEINIITDFWSSLVIVAMYYAIVKLGFSDTVLT